LELFDKNYTKEEILNYVGDISQLGGIRSYEFNEGLSKGVRAVDIISPNGLFLTILPDRGLDISFASYKSIPLCWRSATKEASTMYYENRDNEWLRTYFGGLLITCGLTHMGEPCEESGEKLGLHGRVSSIAAESVLADSEWDGDDYVMWVQGKVRDVNSLGDKLVLKRKITSWMNRPEILIEDEVENTGRQKSAFMILYHMNMGFPILGRSSRLLIGEALTQPMDNESKKEGNLKNYSSFGEPVKGYIDQVFEHDIKPETDGFCSFAFVNPDLNNGSGFGIGFSFTKESLPYLTQWKKLDEGEYVCGLEPSNCYVRGRETERKSGMLKFLNPGEKAKMVVKLVILKDNNEIELFKSKHNL